LSESLEYGRIKRMIKQRAKKREAGELAKYIILVDSDSIPAAFGLAEEIASGDAKVIYAGTKEGVKFMDLYGVRPPAVLERKGNIYKVKQVKYIKDEDEYIINL